MTWVICDGGQARIALNNSRNQKIYLDDASVDFFLVVFSCFEGLKRRIPTKVYSAGRGLRFSALIPRTWYPLTVHPHCTLNSYQQCDPRDNCAIKWGRLFAKSGESITYPYQCLRRPDAEFLWPYITIMSFAVFGWSQSTKLHPLCWYFSTKSSAIRPPSVFALSS